MSRFRWARLLAVLLSLALIAASCGDDDDTETDDSDSADDTSEPSDDTTDAPPGDAIVFGTILPESGSLSVIVDSLRTPLDLAMEEINDAGGVMGRPVAIEGADGGTDDMTIASASFDRLVTSVGIDALIGPASSALAEGLMPEVAAADFVTCNGSSTSSALAALEDGGNWFQFAPNDNLQGPALAEVVNNDGHNAIALLVRNDAYGTGFGEAIVTELENLGLDIVFDEAYDPNGTSFTAEVERLSQSGADAAIIIGFSDDGGKVVSAMIEQGIGPDTLPIYTADGMKSSSFWEAVGSDPSVVEGIKGTAPAAAPSGVEHPFQDRYAQTGVDTIFSPYFYDCMITLALAMEAAGSTDAAAVSAAMFEVTSGENVCQGFAECRDLLESGETIKVSGASGDLSLSDDGAVISGAYDVWAYNAEGVDETLDEPQIQLSLDG